MVRHVCCRRCSCEHSDHAEREDTVRAKGSCTGQKSCIFKRIHVKSKTSLYNLHQLISEATNVTEHSQSLIDLVLTNNISYITYTEVGPALTDLTCFHCPTYGILNCKKHTSTCHKRTIWLMKRVPMIL